MDTRALVFCVPPPCCTWMNLAAYKALQSFIRYHHVDHEAGQAATLNLYYNSIKLHVQLLFKDCLFHFTAPPAICNDLTKTQVNELWNTLQTRHRNSSFDGFTVKKKNTLRTYLKWNPLIQHLLCSVFANALVGHTLETIKQVFFEFRS